MVLRLNSSLLRRSLAKQLHLLTLVLAAAIALIIVPSLGGCSESGESTQVKPGEPEYPQENHHPSLTVQIGYIAPESLSISMSAGYLASTCKREIGLAVTAPLDVEVPIEFSGSGNMRTASVAVDRFEPGGCGWYFSGISYTTLNRPSYGGVLALYDGGLNALGEYALDLWCANAPQIDPKRPERCESLTYLTELKVTLSPEFLASVPQSQKDNAGPVRMGERTRSITVTFRDVDALQNAKQQLH